MDKYSSKIERFIYDELISDIGPCDLNPKITDGSILKTIYDSICSTGVERDISQEQSSHQILETTRIPSIHSVDQLPLLYLFFATLYNTSLISDIVKNTPNFNDFWEFHSWYRGSGCDIDYAKIDNVINSLRNDINAHNKTDTHVNNLVELHSLLYHTDGARSILHSNIYRNRFVSLDIQHDLESTDLVYQKIKIDFSDINVNINIFYPDKGVDIEEKSEIPDIKLIVHIVKAMHSLRQKSKSIPSSSLDLTIIMSSQKKMFDNVEFLSSDNVNSGSTYPGSTVVTWRAEEVYKVLIHELIHYHGFDFGINHPEYDKLENKMEPVISFEGPDAINETYTETLATLINVMFYAYYNCDNDYKNIDKITDISFKKLNLERRFLMWQVAKIVRIFGDEKNKTIRSLLNNDVSIIQTTSVRSYYVYKLFMFFNLIKFIEFIDSKGDVCGLNICDRLEEFGNLIIDSCENFKTLDIVLDKMDEYIGIIDAKYKEHEKQLTSEVSEDKTYPPWIYRTGRMTATNII
jgi:hypothetical protein